MIKIFDLFLLNEQITHSKFDFHGKGTLISLNSDVNFSWQILINQKFDKDDNINFATIEFQCRLGSKELQLDNLDVHSPNMGEYFKIARETLLSQIAKYRIVDLSQF